MDLVFFLRAAITLTFLILAAGGPACVLMLRRFIRMYTVAHEELKIRVSALERIQARVDTKRGE